MQLAAQYLTSLLMNGERQFSTMVKHLPGNEKDAGLDKKNEEMYIGRLLHLGSA